MFDRDPPRALKNCTHVQYSSMPTLMTVALTLLLCACEPIDGKAPKSDTPSRAESTRHVDGYLRERLYRTEEELVATRRSLETWRTVTLAMGDAWQPVNYVKSSLQRLHSALEALGSVEAIRAAT